jgi:hypothetical protein
MLPTATAAALVNPLPRIADILMLFSARAGTTAPAFMVGWIIGMIFVLGVLLFVVPIDEVFGIGSNPSMRASISKILPGIVLLFLAFRRWRSQPKPGEETALPSWMVSLEQATPLTALGLGTRAIASFVISVSRASSGAIRILTANEPLTSA